MIAASFFSYYTVASKPVIERLGSVVTMTYATIIGSVPIVLFASSAGLAIEWREVPAGIWAGIFFGVLISAFMGWLLWGWINAVRGVARTAPLMYLMPPVAGLVAWEFAGEHYTSIKIAGAALTLGGVAVAQDLVLFGATGFTGTQTLKHLVQHVPSGFKWAIAGRSHQKLEALLPLCSDAASQPVIRLADSTDAASVDKLVASTRVLIQLAGPYGKNGEVFVAAAAKHGTHYLDLTGEIGWVAEMIEQAKIIPVCGFEALPFDMAALLIASHLKEMTGERATAVEVINQFTGPPAFRPRDILSGGTMASIKAMLEEGAGASLTDPAALVTDDATATHIRTTGRYDFRARFDKESGVWLAPTVPAPFVNPPVIYRSISLLAGLKRSPFARDCHYEEAMSTRGMAWHRLRSVSAWLLKCSPAVSTRWQSRSTGTVHSISSAGPRPNN